MLVMLLCGFTMNHYIICYHISCGVDVLKMNVHVVLKKVLSLVQTKWHLGEAESTPWHIECGQQL